MYLVWLCTILFYPRTFYWRGSLQVRMDFVSKFSGVWCLPDFMNNFASSFCVFTLRQLHHLLVVLEHQERYGSSSDVICQPSVLPSYLPPSLYVHVHGLLNTDHSWPLLLQSASVSGQISDSVHLDKVTNTRWLQRFTSRQASIRNRGHAVHPSEGL